MPIRWNPPRWMDEDEVEIVTHDGFTRMASEESPGYVDDESLVVAVDGACSGNGTDYPVAGFGVYFGHRNSYNDSGALRSRDTSQRAELVAAIRGMNRVMKLIRNEMPGGKPGWNGKVLVKTDSQYVAMGITSWIRKWKINDWQTAAGNEVANKALWCQLEHRILTLERMYRVDVLFWRVRRELNEDADGLAKWGAQMG